MEGAQLHGPQPPADIDPREDAESADEADGACRNALLRLDSACTANMVLNSLTFQQVTPQVSLAMAKLPLPVVLQVTE